MLITNTYAIGLTRQYPDVLAADSTYQTNDLELPVLNIVGFTNLGTTELTTFVAATVVMFNERKISYTWAFQTLKDTVWQQQQPNVKV
jgi:hypothetical protein